MADTADKAAKAAADPVLAVIQPAVKVGLACGATGFLFGGTAAVIRSNPPMLFATASAIQTFTIGTTFWASRTFVLHARVPASHEPRLSDLSTASTVAGGFTGCMVALLFRGRSNVIPGGVMFSLFGYVGQEAHNRYSARKATEAELEPRKGFWMSMSEKAWSPVTVMSDEEYAELLRKKMMRVDVEIAILDDRIEALQKEQQMYDAKKTMEAKEAE